MDKGKCVLVRATAGVFVGYLESRDGKEVTLTEARRLWYWAGASSLSQVAEEGVKRPLDCKFPPPVKRVLVLDALEVLDVSASAEKNIKDVPEWRQ